MPLCAPCLPLEVLEERMHKLFGVGALEKRAIEETRAKYVAGRALRVQLKRLKENWDGSAVETQ